MKTEQEIRGKIEELFMLNQCMDNVKDVPELELIFNKLRYLTGIAFLQWVLDEVEE